MNRFAVGIGISLLFAGPVPAQGDKDLNGVWVGVSAKNAGDSLDDFAKSAKLSFDGGKYEATLEGVTEKGTFTADRGKKPNHIDMKPSEGQMKGKTMLAIYELKGETLTICSKVSTTERPKDFTSTEQNNHIVIVYKRKQ